MENRNLRYQDFLTLKVDTKHKHNNGEFLWEEVKTAGPHPSRRSYHSSVMWNHKMVISGGQDLREGTQSGIWVFDFNSMDEEHWEELNIIGIGVFCRHSSVIYRDNLYIFGGTDGINEFDTTWIIDLNTLQTRKLDPQTLGLPPPLDSHTATLYEKDGLSQMVVFGGFKYSERTNDLYILNLSSLEWRKISTNNGPEPRSNHSAVIYNDFLFIFGGLNGEGEQIGDFWKLNLNTYNWQSIQAGGQIPAARSGHSAIVYSDLMVIFGGTKCVNRETNEMFSYSFENNMWVRFQDEQQVKDPVSAAQLEEFKHSETSPHRRHTLNIAIGPKKDGKKEASPTIERFAMKKKLLYDGPPSPVKGRVKGNAPHQRDGHSAVIDGNIMYIFGGDRHQMPFNDIYAYRLSKDIISRPGEIDLKTS
ncbi:unnamed protein product [Blepharisma stoltei]|uniref:Galactose oxidase n=1 Tax=Blepharisma stoltei TaxID=1481888 RepID=A0AAU9KMU1_9CILI|nr:unnamed protein product [Blepharisma stoltei]